MEFAFHEFILQIIDSPILCVITLLILGCIFINGCIDAPNAIATCVSTKSITPRKALIMFAIFCFLGTFVMTLFSSTVAQTIYNIVDFGDNSQNALIALTAALVAIFLWSLVTWIFGIPTSQSHALIAGISGAAIAIQSSISGINIEEWMKVICGLFISIVLAFILGYIFTKGIERTCKKFDRVKAIPFFKNSQILGGATMSFMQGAQEGQKFIGIFLLGIALSNGITDSSTFEVPIWLIIVCSSVMSLGAIIGGYRIIKTIGMKMAKLEAYQGTASDLAAATSLFTLSIFGIPVSTTQTKTTAIMGVGASKRLSNVNWKLVKNMAITWIITFPGCGILGYATTLLFMKIFM